MPVPCPYVYAKGRRCPGHIARIEAFKADLSWTLTEDGSWQFELGSPRSHYHVYCSKKGNHAGYGRPDAQSMKLFFSDLPDELQRGVSGPSL